MASIIVQNAGLIYSDELFAGLSFSVNDRDKLGVVANNGAGKSTLLKCLAGSIEPTTGKIVRSRSSTIGYVEQTVPASILSLPLRAAIVDALSPEQKDLYSWRGDYWLDFFQAPSEMRDRPLAQLSGGWQRLALVARTWISDPDIILLDEPTNHLDLSKTLLLERWLNSEIGDTPIVVVSHDRRFLDECTNKTLFLRKLGSKLYSYSYTHARELLAKDDASDEARQQKEIRELQRLKRSAHELRQIGKNNFSDAALRKSNQMAKRAESMEDSLTVLHVEERREIKLSNRGTHANRLLGIAGMDVSSPDGKSLFHIERLDIAQRDRVIILGRNGCGKTCFIKKLRTFLTNPESAGGSGMMVSPTLVYSYVDQHMSQLPEHEAIRDFVNSAFALGEQRTTSVLASAGFSFDQQGQKIGTLSPGQKSRLALLAFRLAHPNFYLMDEPTNHLDIAGQLQFEVEVCDHEATAVVVSHDRTFVENIGTRFLVIERSRLWEIESPVPFYESLLEDVLVTRVTNKAVAR